MKTKLPMKFASGEVVYTTKFKISRVAGGVQVIIHYFDDDGTLIEAEDIMTLEESYPYRKALLDGLLDLRKEES